MNKGEYTTQISVTKDSKEAEVLCLLQTNVRLSSPSTRAKKNYQHAQLEGSRSESKVLTEMMRSRADNGKKTALVSRGKSRAIMAASLPPNLSHEQKLIRQLRGVKDCRLTDLRPS